MKRFLYLSPKVSLGSKDKPSTGGNHPVTEIGGEVKLISSDNAEKSTHSVGYRYNFPQSAKKLGSHTFFYRYSGGNADTVGFEFSAFSIEVGVKNELDQQGKEIITSSLTIGGSIGIGL